MISNFKTSKFLLDKAQSFADFHSYRLAIQDDGSEPIATETYLKETFLPNDNDFLGIGFDACIEQLSIYQIDVYTPKGQGGKFPSTNIGDLLMVEFNRGPIIFNDTEQTIQIESSSSKIMNSNQTHNWTMVQVNVKIIADNT